MRVDGKFVDADGNRPEGQYVSFFCLSSIHQAHSPAVGPALSLAPMLRSYLPVALVERTRFGGVDADSTVAFLMFRRTFTHRLVLTGEQAIDCQEVPQ